MSNAPATTPSGGRAKRGLEAVTNWVLAHRRAVAAFWVVLTLAGFYGAGQVTDALEDDFSMPESQSYAANQEIEARFGAGGSAPPLVAVAELPPGERMSDPGVRADLRELERDLAGALPGARAASYGSTGERAYVSEDGRTTFAVVHPPIDPEARGPDAGLTPEQLDAAREVAAEAEVGGADVLLTGEEPLTDAPEEEGGGGPEFLSETLIAGLAALGVLAFVFASALALVPILIAIVAIPVTLLAVLGLTAVVDVSFIVVFLVALIGLGIAIDYALIVVMRWREERARGRENEDAIRVAVSTAGRAVLFSGTTVAIGLLAALVLPIPFLQSMAYGGLLIPLVSVATALTLLPMLLATVGPRADRRRLRRTDRADRHWAAWARTVVRHRVVAVAAGASVLVALIGVASGMLLGSPEAEDLGGSGEPREALTMLERSGIGASPLAPVEVVTSAERAKETAAELADVEGVRAAIAPGAWRDGDRAVVDVFTAADTNSGDGRDAVERITAAAGGIPATAVGGQTALTIDWVDSVYGSFPLMLGLISLITFVLLARAFRSLVLPAKAIAMNLLSVLATWGVMALVWQQGVGTELLFGTDPTGSVAFWAPMIVFAFIYGLSMDYEVFILARIREEYERTGSTDEAVVRGIASTGRLVTSAALIVFLAFASMGLEGDVEVQMLATGLAAGVLLDAVVVRTLLVPATVSWLGRWNWWLPEPARRLLRLPPTAEPALERA